MSTPVQTRLSDDEIRALDAAIARGRFSNRSDALRAGLQHLLREDREREIAAAYARGYGEKPQEDWIGEAGFALLSAAASAAERGKDPI